MVVINVILSAFINGVQKTNSPSVHAFGGRIPCNASSQCLTGESESVSLQFPVATEGRKLFKARETGDTRNRCRLSLIRFHKIVRKEICA